LISNFEKWFELKTTNVNFGFSRQVADILLIDDKKKLIDKNVRKKICPKLTNAQIISILKNYSTDELDQNIVSINEIIKQIGNESENKPVYLTSNLILRKSILNENDKGLLFNHEINQPKSSLSSVKISTNLSSKKELQFLNK